MTVYAACCQTAFSCPTHRDEIPTRVDRMLEMAASAVDGYEPFHEVRLIVFPEFAHSAPIHPKIDDLDRDLAGDHAPTSTWIATRTSAPGEVSGFRPVVFIERHPDLPGSTLQLDGSGGSGGRPFDLSKGESLASVRAALESS